MPFDMSRIHELDISGVSPDALRDLRERLFGPAPKNAMEEALNDALRKKARAELWKVYAGEAQPVTRPDARPYRFRPEHIYALALATPPKRVGIWVTDFTHWVHDLYGYATGTREAMERGNAAERSVAKLARPPTNPNWKLIYYSNPLGERPPAMVISSLTLRGKALVGSPDLVFRHRRTGEVAIIDRKCSDKSIPLDGWPDLRAQLWCYAQIDAWRDAPAIRLIGEVWFYDGRRLYRRVNGGGLLCWVKGDPTFEETNAKLFALYKSHIEET